MTFNTDLNLYNKKKTLALPQYIWIFHLVLLGLLLSECEREIILFIISPNIEFGIVLVFVIKFRRIISRTIFGCLLRSMLQLRQVLLLMVLTIYLNCVVVVLPCFVVRWVELSIFCHNLLILITPRHN